MRSTSAAVSSDNDSFAAFVDTLKIRLFCPLPIPLAPLLPILYDGRDKVNCDHICVVDKSVVAVGWFVFATRAFPVGGTMRGGRSQRNGRRPWEPCYGAKISVATTNTTGSSVADGSEAAAHILHIRRVSLDGNNKVGSGEVMVWCRVRVVLSGNVWSGCGRATAERGDGLPLSRGAREKKERRSRERATRREWNVMKCVWCRWCRWRCPRLDGVEDARIRLGRG